MLLFLLRHGIAVEPGTPGLAHDSERPLTPEGRRKVRRLARALVRLEVQPGVILTSPFVRARQTAELVAAGLGLEKRLVVCEPLACGGSPKQLVAEINRSHGRAASVMLVGHEPDLSEFAALLLTGRAGGAQIQMKKGGLCLLEVDTLRAGRCAVLQWLAPPRLLG